MSNALFWIKLRNVFHGKLNSKQTLGSKLPTHEERGKEGEGTKENKRFAYVEVISQLQTKVQTTDGAFFLFFFPSPLGAPWQKCIHITRRATRIRPLSVVPIERFFGGDSFKIKFLNKETVSFFCPTSSSPLSPPLLRRPSPHPLYLSIPFIPQLPRFFFFPSRS